MTRRKRQPANAEVSEPQSPERAPDLAAAVKAEVAKALRAREPKRPDVAVCAYCGKRYRPGRATRPVVGAGDRFACGWCVRWTDHNDHESLTEARILDSAVCRLVGRRTTINGAAMLVSITPFYAIEDAAPSSRRWAFIDRDALIADFDRCYPPPRVGGAVVGRDYEETYEKEIPGLRGKTQTKTRWVRDPWKYVPAPAPPLQRSPRRPPTEAEKRRDAIEAKRTLAAQGERRRQSRLRRAGRELAKQARAIANLEAS